MISPHPYSAKIRLSIPINQIETDRNVVVPDKHSKELVLQVPVMFLIW
ncbi:MAG: hypothetical protein RJA81_1338 [Planctomycetota bacterium]